MEKSGTGNKQGAARRSFLKKGAFGVGAAAIGGFLAKGSPAFAQEPDGGSLTKGDAAILQLLLAAEIIGVALMNRAVSPSWPRRRRRGEPRPGWCRR